MPVNRIDMMAKITRTCEELQHEGTRPSLNKVAKELGFTEEKVERTLINNQPIRSLDANFEDGEESCLMDCLADDRQPCPEEQIFESALQKDKVLTGLNRREAEVLRLYFGLGQESPLPLDQIGIRFKLTRERVWQIKEVALSKLRHPRFHIWLRSYAEV